MERLERHGCRADLVGQRRETDGHALTGKAFGLAIEGLVLTELFKKDCCKQVGSGKAAWGGRERRCRLASLLTRPAAVLLPHRLDHFPLARDHLERLGHILTQLDQVT